MKRHRTATLAAVLIVVAVFAAWLTLQRSAEAARAEHVRQVELNNRLAMAAEHARMEEEHACSGLSPIKQKQCEVNQLEAKARVAKAQLDKATAEYRRLVVEAQREQQKYDSASLFGKLRIRVTNWLKSL